MRLGPGRELRDDRLVERVADVGPIQREVFDRTVAANVEELKGMF